MKISEICIKRPVLSIVINLILILVGMVAFWRLPINEYPKFERPTLSIETEFHGAGPEIIENTVTKVLEEELAKIEGLDFITSTSMRGKSNVYLHFNMDRSLDAAAMDVLFKVARIRSLLPTDVRDPMMIKSDANASPVMYLALNSSSRVETDLADYARRYLENPLGNLNGVSKVEILGGGQFVMRIWLHPQKLAAHGLNALDVYNEIRRQNVERPGGSIVGGDRQYNVSTTARIRSPEEFNQLIVGNKNGKFIRLEDVGHAIVGTQDETTSFIFNGKKAVALIIYKKSEGSPLTVADLIKKELPKVQERLPSDMTLKVAYDSTTFIEVAIEEVYETIIIAISLVLLVVFGFIGSLRAAIIPMVTIPISLIGTCILIYIWGFSINILTLLAMVLAVGLVVDDAIVVLENIYRYIEDGLSPMKAALKGSKEIGFAVVAMTITLAAVYAPLSLAQGITGQLFREFALTLAGAVILSGFVALTLSPMMCSRILKSHHEDMGVVKIPQIKSLFNWIAKALKTLDEEYAKLLKFSLNHRLVVVLIGLAFTGLSWGLMTKFLPSKFVPDEDRGIIRGKGDATKGLTLDALDRYVMQLDAIIDNNPAIENRLLMVKMPEVTVISSLKPWAQRKKSSHDILKQLNPELKKVVGLGITLSNQRSFGSGGKEEGSITFVLQSMKPMEEIIATSRKLLQGFADQQSDIDLRFYLPVNMQDFNVNINRDVTSYVGLSAEDIATTMEIFTKGKKVGNYMPQGDTKEYDIIVGVEKEFRRSPSDLSDVYMKVQKKNEEKIVPISQLINVEEKLAPTQIEHYNRMRNILFVGDIASKASIAKAVENVKSIASKTISKDYIIEFTGETRKFLQESGNMLFVFSLAILFIYLVLAAQFESFIDPLIILFSVPLSLAGAVITLLLLKDGSMNIFSQIGMVTLIGLITKHGILIVDFANALQDQGKNAFEAVTEACRLRLRPILMTTGAMIFGAVPLALANGAGSEIRSNVGWVIVGGMSFGTLFTLFVVPAVYTYLTRKKTIHPDLQTLI